MSEQFSFFFARAAARWAKMCMLSSPWLFTAPEVRLHTIATHVNVHFIGVPVDEMHAFVAEANETKAGFNCALIRPTKAVMRINEPDVLYEPWSNHFEFRWESLELRIERTATNAVTAVFVDCTGAVSRRMFVQDGEGSCGIDVTDPNNELISWLYCQT